MTTTSADSFGVCVVQSVRSGDVIAKSVWVRLLGPNDDRTYFCLASLRSRSGLAIAMWLKAHACYSAAHITLSGDAGVVIPPDITLAVDGEVTRDATVGLEWQLFAPAPEPHEI